MSIDDAFIAETLTGYAACMIWVGSDWSSEPETGNPTPLDDAGYSVEDIPSDVLATMMQEVRDFVLANAADIAASGQEAGQVGHDFCLTRNRHGAGFWDRGLGAIGDRLTDAAHVYGESNLDVGDDGTLYLSS